MKQTNLEFKNEIVFLREPLTYPEKAGSSSSLLQNEMDTILRNLVVSLLNGNDFMLYKNSAKNEQFGIAIKLMPDKVTSNQTLLDMAHLGAEIENPDGYFYQRYSENLNSLFMTSSFFDCPAIDSKSDSMSEWKKILSLFNELLKYSSLCCLKFQKTEKNEAKATLVISSEDLYDLKTGSKLFRGKCKNYEEYFYQKTECTDVLRSISNLDNISIEKDDAHRVIFSK